MKIKNTIQIKDKVEKDQEFDNNSKIAYFKPTPRKTENLAVLGKVWGFLKYFHPVVGKGTYNWDFELFRILPKIIESKNQSESTSDIMAFGEQERLLTETFGQIIRPEVPSQTSKKPMTPRSGLPLLLKHV